MEQGPVLRHNDQLLGPGHAGLGVRRGGRCVLRVSGGTKDQMTAKAEEKFGSSQVEFGRLLCAWVRIDHHVVSAGTCGPHPHDVQVRVMGWRPIFPTLAVGTCPPILNSGMGPMKLRNHNLDDVSSVSRCERGACFVGDVGSFLVWRGDPARRG